MSLKVADVDDREIGSLPDTAGVLILSKCEPTGSQLLSYDTITGIRGVRGGGVSEFGVRSLGLVVELRFRTSINQLFLP